MTDIAKAIAFATRCLKWDAIFADDAHQHGIVRDISGKQFDSNSACDLQRVLQEFLGNRYFIQINRGTSSLFHWRVIAGVQDRSAKGAELNNAQAEGEDLWDCIFDACVQAAHL